MAKIERVEVLMVDLKPKVKRTDAIQAFVSQETPIVRVFADDGAVGTGYCYTIGTGGHAIVELLARNLAPELIGRDPERVEEIWRALFFHTHATAVGAMTALALAAIDTALWDMRCRRSGRPLHVEAGGAQASVPLYTTEGGWLHIATAELVEDALRARAAGFGGSKIKVGRPPKEDVARLAAVREAVGDGFEIMVDGNQGAAVDEAIRRARLYEPFDLAWYEEPLPAEDLGGHIRLSSATTLPIAVGESIYSLSHFREYLQRDACSVVQVDVARIGGITPWLKTAHLAEAFNVAVCPAFPDGAARFARRSRAERPLDRVHPAARQPDDDRDADRAGPRGALGRARPRHRLGLGRDRPPAGRRRHPRDPLKAGRSMARRAEAEGRGASPLYELIYGVLREHIVDGSFPTGLVLGESTVARAFNASRVPAAAALKRLRREGLVRDFGGRGYLAGNGKAVAPVRLELSEAGLRLPPAVETGLKIRNRRERIYPDVEHVVAACLPYGRFQVNESLLAEHYGVSRTVAHEVLTRLERTGLVTQDTNQRWYAGPLTSDLIHDHFEMRALLEPVALAQVLPELRPDDLRKKRERARRVQAGRRTLAKIERLERDLHVDIILKCRNQQLREAIRRSQLVLIAVHHAFDVYRDAAAIGLMIAEHLTILGHLLAGRGDQAVRVLEAHLRRSLAQNIELVRNLGPLPEARRAPFLITLE